MSSAESSSLKEKISKLEEELKQLKAELQTAEGKSQQQQQLETKLLVTNYTETTCNFTKCDLNNIDIQRYSRQMILPEIGVQGIFILKLNLFRNPKPCFQLIYIYIYIVFIKWVKIYDTYYQKLVTNQT